MAEAQPAGKSEASSYRNGKRTAPRNISRGLYLLGSFLLLLLLFLPIEDTHPLTAQAAYDHALSLLLHGDLIEGQQEAALGYRRFESSDPSWAAKFKLLLAQAMLYRGMYEDALDTLSSYSDSANRENTVLKLAIEAVALTRQQKLLLADQKLTQAEAICKNEDLAPCGDVETARAIFDAKQGRLRDARQHFLSALTVARSHNNSWLEAKANLNLGFMALQMNHFDEAIDWSGSAYREAAASGYQNLMQIASGNLGWAYYQSGDDGQALQYFVAAADAAAHTGDIHEHFKWISNAGHVYRDEGNLSQALDCYRSAFLIAKQLNNKEDIELALEEVAQLSEMNRNLNDANAYIHQVTPMESAAGGKLSPNLMLTKGYLAFDLHRYDEAAADLRSVWSDRNSSTTLRLDAGAELATLDESQGRLGDAEKMYKSALAVYESERATLRKEETQLPFGANATQVYDDYIHLLVGQKRTGEALAVAAQSRARMLEQGLDANAGTSALRFAASNSQRIDPRHIAQVSDATLFFYWLGEKQSYLWTITPARMTMFALPPRAEIAARVKSYNSAILNLRDPRAENNQDGLWLYNTLIAPARALVQPRKPIVILDDGALSELNFDTLLVPGSVAAKIGDANATPYYLIEDFTLVSAPSLEVLGARRDTQSRNARMLLLGDPVSPSQDYPTLPLFGYEMTKIRSHFRNDQLAILSGAQATPAAYLASHPSQYSYIHFVSHATASSSDPLDSAIVLSRSSADESSFKLYARDIVSQPIDAQLVTISACYGSGTRLYAGEGLVGLSWAFLRAGAHRVIGALWEVSDASTPRLMDSFYGHVANGESPESSLRAAKLDLVHATGRFSLPYYWAVFQMYDRQ